MFKQLRDGIRLPKIVKAMNAADVAIDANRLETAEDLLEDAYNLILDTTLIRSALINCITAWRFMAIKLNDKKSPELAARCSKMADLLQARFNAGDYYRES